MGSHYTVSKGSVFCIQGPEDDFTISRNMLPIQYASTINIGVLDGHFLILLLVHSTHTYPPMKMEQTECSETSAHTIQMPENYPEEIVQHSEHGKSLKSRIRVVVNR